MEIDITGSGCETMFCDIKPGVVYKYDGHYYIKTINGNGIGILTGCNKTMEPTDEVSIPENATCIITE